MVFSPAPESRIMNGFLMLRDNRQIGPFSREELAGMQIRPTDLFWVEAAGCWRHAAEIPELRQMEPDISDAGSQVRIHISLPAGFRERNLSPMPGGIQNGFFHPDEETEDITPEIIPDKKSIWSGNFHIPEKTFSVIATFLGVVLGAIIIKKVIDSQPVAINPEATMVEPRNTIRPERIPEEFIQNALTKEYIKPEAPAVKSAPVKPLQLKDIRKKVTVSSNNYRARRLGGIENLVLTVKNGSDHRVDHVTIEVTYLKPGGQAVRTEQHEVHSLRPGTSKSLQIPPSNRGVKVKARVLNITSTKFSRIQRRI